MRARLGIWHNEIALFLRERGYDRIHLALEKMEDDTTRLVVDMLRDDARWPCLHDTDADERMDYPWEVRTSYEYDGTFTRCGLMDVTVIRPQYNSYWGHVELPPDHLLPWPHLRDCDSYDSAEELFLEVEKRRLSAEGHGVRLSVPPYIQIRLTPEMRIGLFNRQT